jgi:hypothetical protein
LPDYVARAEVLVVAVGRANLVKGDWIKEGAVVIDVGINRISKDQADPALLEWRKDDFEKKGRTLLCLTYSFNLSRPCLYRSNGKILRLTADVYPEILNTVSQTCAYIFPEVNIK